jgi:hypothetical protein
VEFSYKLTGTGWGEARIADEEAHVVLPTSYLSDVLGDLLQALGILLEGSPTAECSWEEEPGEYRWVFNSSDDDVALRILAFRNSWPRRPEEEGEVVVATVGPLRDIADAIVTGAAAVLDEYGEDEYQRRWVQYPFPAEMRRFAFQRGGVPRSAQLQAPQASNR